MEIQTLLANKRKDVALGNLKGGEVFRFSHIPEVDAVSEKAFYMVVTRPDSKGVLVANVATGECLQRDKEHRVVKYICSIGIQGA